MKEKKELTFKDVYKLPFRYDEDSGIYIFCKNSVLAFNTLTPDVEYKKELVRILNGESNNTIEGDVTQNGEVIIVNGNPVLLIRGWGYLTGCGGLGLFPFQAARIQDDFANWVVNKLKGIEV